MSEFSIPEKLIALTEMCVSGSKIGVRIGTLSGYSITITIALEKVITDAEVDLEFFSPNGPQLLLAYPDDIDIIEISACVTK